MKKKIIATILLIAGLALSWLFYRTEISIGRCLNECGDGKLYNGEEFYNYICYPEWVRTNDIVMTVDLLNPLNNYCDDTVFRYDVVVLEDVGNSSEWRKGV